MKEFKWQKSGETGESRSHTEGTKTREEEQRDQRVNYIKEGWRPVRKNGDLIDLAASTSGGNT